MEDIIINKFKGILNKLELSSYKKEMKENGINEEDIRKSLDFFNSKGRGAFSVENFINWYYGYSNDLVGKFKQIHTTTLKENIREKEYEVSKFFGAPIDDLAIFRFENSFQKFEIQDLINSSIRYKSLKNCKIYNFEENKLYEEFSGIFYNKNNHYITFSDKGFFDNLFDDYEAVKFLIIDNEKYFFHQTFLEFYFNEDLETYKNIYLFKKVGKHDFVELDSFIENFPKFKKNKERVMNWFDKIIFWNKLYFLFGGFGYDEHQIHDTLKDNNINNLKDIINNYKNYK